MAVAFKRLSDITKRSPEAVLGAIKTDSESASREAGLKLASEARSYGQDMRNYLRLAVSANLSDKKANYDTGNGVTLDGYESALLFLGLPTKDNFDQGSTLDLAADTFATYPGSRIMFPEVVDDVVRWNYRDDPIESLAKIISGSRTIAGSEMISVVVPDEAFDYEVTRPIAEGGRIPVHSIQETEKKVRFAKYGMGWRMTYEFDRRARLDIWTPYIARTLRHTERSKIAAATQLIINGDGAVSSDGKVYNGPATVVTQGSFDAKVGTVRAAARVPGQLSMGHFLAWLVSRGQAGYPIDVLIGNYDMYLQWLFLFQAPLLGQAGISTTAAQVLEQQGIKVASALQVLMNVEFALSSTAPEGKLIGISKAECVEELVEGGSLIEESERACSNQTITYYRTQNAGFRMPFGNARSILDVTA